MRSVFYSVVFLTCSGLFLTGCASNNAATVTNSEVGQNNQTAPTADTQSVVTTSGNCQPGPVKIEGYGDPGTRLANCFVQYPGEPSRQDKSYYIVEDVCGQFTKEFMEGAYGAGLAKIVPSAISSVNSCAYYFDDKEFLTVNLEYLSFENQKKGNEAIGYQGSVEAKIPMENWVVKQEDGAINVIYLVLEPEKFISLRPSSKATINSEKFISLAANIGQAIKSYK